MSGAHWGWIVLATATALAETGAAQQLEKPRPTKAEVKYGPHERNVLDFWKAPAEAPTPLAIFIHGGGFQRGGKEQLNAEILRELLESGISVASLNYRFADQAPLPAAHEDCRLALQFLRTQASQWGFDKTRVAAFGSSAGAQLSMYLAFHDEMARPTSDIPWKRESTRLTCVATLGGQTTLDIAWREKHVPGHADHQSRETFLQRFRVSDLENYQRAAAPLAALTLISADDPPIFMSYTMSPDDPVPADAKQAENWTAHHVNFGVALKEKTDSLGIKATVAFPQRQAQANRDIAAFFRENLKPSR
jgi:acetyl esterase